MTEPERCQWFCKQQEAGSGVKRKFDEVVHAEASVVQQDPDTAPPATPPRPRDRTTPRSLPPANTLRQWLGLNAAPPAQRISAVSRRAKRPFNLRPLTLGTDCSGMDAAAYAIKGLQIPLVHTFASDPNPAAQAHMRANHNIQNLYNFLHDRPTARTDLDVYAAGPPCQPFSDIGQLRGLQDPRAAIYGQTIDFLILSRPKIGIIENVPGLKIFDRGRHLASLIERLSAPSVDAPHQFYHVTHHITSTHRHGVPHYRRRLYLICIRADVQQTPFIMPDDITPLTITQLLDPPNQADNANNRPAAPTATRIVNILADPAPPQDGAGHPTDYIVDDMVGKERGKTLRPRHNVPCFLHSRKQGFWIVTRGRRLNLQEALRFQGFNPDRIQIPQKATDLHQLLGNTMSINVIQRILLAALHSTGMYKHIKDPWESGTAQVELTTHAHNTTPIRYIRTRPSPHQGNQPRSQSMVTAAANSSDDQISLKHYLAANITHHCVGTH